MSLAEIPLSTIRVGTGESFNVESKKALRSVASPLNGVVNFITYEVLRGYLNSKKSGFDNPSSVFRFMKNYQNQTEVNKLSSFEALYIATNNLLETYMANTGVTKFKALTDITTSGIRGLFGVQPGGKDSWSDNE